jgi:hypothetical protein
MRTLSLSRGVPRVLSHEAPRVEGGRFLMR